LVALRSRFSRAIPSSISSSTDPRKEAAFNSPLVSLSELALDSSWEALTLVLGLEFVLDPCWGSLNFEGELDSCWEPLPFVIGEVDLCWESLAFPTELDSC
jgi:hypothetical protein